MSGVLNPELEKVTLQAGAPAFLLRAYILGPVDNPESNSAFNGSLAEIFEDPDLIPADNLQVKLKNGASLPLVYEPENRGEKVQAINLKKFNARLPQRIFLFANLRAEEECGVILRILNECRVKVWINRRMVFSGFGGYNKENQLVLARLCQGDNPVVIEFKPNLDGSSSEIAMRVHRYQEKPAELDAGFYPHFENQLALVDELVDRRYHLEGTHYPCMFLPRDYLRLDPAQEVRVLVKDETGHLYSELQTRCGEKLSIPLAELQARNPRPIAMMLEAVFEIPGGTEVRQKFYLALSMLERMIADFEAQYQALLAARPLAEPERATITGTLDYLKDASLLLRPYPWVYEKDWAKLNQPFVFTWREERDFAGVLLRKQALEKILAGLRDGMALHDIVRQGGSYEIYFRSKLDERLEKYQINVPANPAPGRQHPLVLLLPTARYEHFWIFDDQLDSLRREYPDVIFASITFRGNTFGSYIGEAAFAEGLDRITREFKVDPQRIYLVAYSNAAFAAWCLAEIYPQRFAGIAVMSGQSYFQNLMNVRNLRILNVCGEHDYLLQDVYTQPNKLLAEINPKYESVLVPAEDHWSIECYICWNKKYFLDRLLPYTAEAWPEKVSYRSERSRHCAAQGLEIVGCEKAGEASEVHVQRLGWQGLKVWTKHTAALRLQIPAAADLSSFSIHLDHEVFTCPQPIEPGAWLSFEKQDRHWTLAGPTPRARSGYGMGILEIFMDSVKVVVPEIPAATDEIIKKVAANLSGPVSLGWDPQIKIRYPVITDKETTPEIMQNSNLILIGCGENHALLNRWRAAGQLLATLEPDAIRTTLGCVEGKYCVLFIQPNPDFPDHKILVVYANDPELFKKNLFTRRLIIPTYANGMHPYLNQDMVLFDGKNYSHGSFSSPVEKMLADAPDQVAGRQW